MSTSSMFSRSTDTVGGLVPRAITTDGEHRDLRRTSYAEPRRDPSISERHRRMLVRWLRRTARRGLDPRPVRRSREVLLCDRVAAVRGDLLEIAALLDQAPNPDPVRVAALHELLANGCDSPLYNPDIHVRELRTVLRDARAALAGVEDRIELSHDAHSF